MLSFSKASFIHSLDFNTHKVKVSLFSVNHTSVKPRLNYLHLNLTHLPYLLLPPFHRLCCDRSALRESVHRWPGCRRSHVVHRGSHLLSNRGNISTPFLSPSCTLSYTSAFCMSDTWGRQRNLWNLMQVFIYSDSIRHFFLFLLFISGYVVNLLPSLRNQIEQV